MTASKIQWTDRACRSCGRETEHYVAGIHDKYVSDDRGPAMRTTIYRCSVCLMTRDELNEIDEG